MPLVTQQLAPLALVALFIERSLEIFLTVWRGSDTESLQRKLDAATALPDGDATKAERVRTANDALGEYRSETQRIALRGALVLGVLISALGVRGLGSLADLDSFPATPASATYSIWWTSCYRSLDGWRLGFRAPQIITTFTDLMNATSQKAKTNV